MNTNDNYQHDFEQFLDSYRINKNKPLKTLFYLYRGNIKRLLISSLFFLIKHSPVWIIPVVTANIINIASQPAKHSITELWVNLGIAALVIIQNIPTHMLHVKFFSRAIRYVEAGLRGTLVRKLQQLSISFHKDFKSGKLQSKILRDVEAIEFLLRQFYTTLLPVVFNVIVALVVTVNKSLAVTLFFLMTLPVSVLLIIFFRTKIGRTNNEFRREIEEMSTKVSEMVEMIPVTKAHGLEDYAIAQVDNQLERVQDRGYRLDIITAYFGASSWVVFQMFQVLCLAFTGFLAYRGRISIGDVVLYQGYFTSILSQISNTINIYPNLSKGIESIKSLGEILLADDIEDNRGKIQLKEVKGAFSFKDVEFSYRLSDGPVLHNFNLEVQAGECIALVGESGVGKTTVLNFITAFHKPTEGKILLDGIDLADIDLHHYRQYIAVVPQNTILFAGSIRDNITYGLPSISDRKLWEIIESANLKEFIEQLPGGLDTIIGEQDGKLSGGQRQRIAIARALIRDPKIIVFDEATSALDNRSELQVQAAIKQLIQGKTTFIVAHRLSTIRNANRIAVIKNGTCVELGTFEELEKLRGEFYHLKQLEA